VSARLPILKICAHSFINYAVSKIIPRSKEINYYDTLDKLFLSCQYILSKEVCIMDDIERLRPLLDKLGEAINESVSESPAIAQAVETIRKAGFELFLVMEVTVGFHKSDPTPKELGPGPHATVTPLVTGDGAVDPGTFNEKDKKLLHGLRITLDDPAK